MPTPNKPKFEIPEDLFDNPKRDIKVAAVQKLAIKSPARIALLIRAMMNRDKK